MKENFVEMSFEKWIKNERRAYESVDEKILS